MAVYGRYGSLTWTKSVDPAEGNAQIVTASIFRIVLRTRRPMREITPLSWNSKEFAPGHYDWRAEVHAYMGDSGSNPGFLNDTVAQIAIYSNTGGGDKYSGYCWVEGMRVTVAAEEVETCIFDVRGTGDIARAFA